MAEYKRWYECPNNLFDLNTVAVAKSQEAKNVFDCEACDLLDSTCNGPKFAKVGKPRANTQLSNFLVKLYNLGVPINTIAQACELEPTYIRTLVRDTDEAEKRTLSECHTIAREFNGIEERNKAIQKLYIEGVPTIVITKSFGITFNKFQHILERDNIPHLGIKKSKNKYERWRKFVVEGIDE